MGRELWMNDIRGREQMLGTDQVAGVRRRLGGVDRKACQAALLRALDLTIPVRAFHQAHRHAAARIARQLRDPVDDQRRTPAVGLNRQPQAIPRTSLRITRQSFDNIQREI